MIYLAIIPLALVGYGMIIANSYPTRTCGIIVKYITKSSAEFILGGAKTMTISRLTFVSSMLRQFGYFTFDFPSKRKIPKIKVYLEK